jgi:hypothetical protein
LDRPPRVDTTCGEREVKDSEENVQGEHEQQSSREIRDAIEKYTDLQTEDD